MYHTHPNTVFLYSPLVLVTHTSPHPVYNTVNLFIATNEAKQGTVIPLKLHVCCCLCI